MKPKDLALIVALGVGGVASTATGAEIEKVGEETVQPTIGHTTRYETYEIIAGEGDTVQTIVDQLNAQGLRNNYLSAPTGGYRVEVGNLVRQNPALKKLEFNKDGEIIKYTLVPPKAGQVLQYTRVSVEFTGFHILG
ncbi:MAG: hypothetical protein Q7R76_04575 [Candidatus Woesearchaeota archaeon]|nr:hypothetical protein [Candidatus Woesearchaeota archaeon]